METTQVAPASMIDRMVSVLELLRGHQRLTLAQVSRRSSLPRSSAHRILQRLVDFGWVERDGYGYGLGIRVFELGSHVARHDPVHRAAALVLGDLHRSTGLSVHLSALSEDDVVHLERVGASGANWGVGTRSPAVHTAPGRALLAWLAPEELPHEVVSPPSPRGIRSAQQLERELAHVRRSGGLSIDAQLGMPGITVVAAPIGPEGVRARMALSVSGPCELVRVERVAGALRTTAMDIWCAATGVSRLPRRVKAPTRIPSTDVAM
ncbi:IclR family transcriptional regulator [Saccharopolyspora flava]|uniref:Transcriptional regulator, IclR family n=1 Tax=Saccharopolyspora flava TaxID=95161 RepID=A0A1I6UF02_9PSEU|nr:helix-turn-helix domain-containing protein [Saccharopolyspora flava]SFT00049.1 transcriptional regulator, IclR family [Saccharopolyspora flava]